MLYDYIYIYIYVYKWQNIFIWANYDIKMLSWHDLKSVTFYIMLL